MQRPYRLSCHCGNIRLEVDADLADLVECNCSTCRRSGFLHWKVAEHQVRLVDEKRVLSTYVWRAVSEGHHFCPTCSVAIMRSGYSNNRVSLNARCIDNIDVFSLEVARYDGRDDMPPGPLR
ncbi:GFA family protein [Pararhizobium antarcticum]|uniref:Gfa-like protein n=1 Tax=Pararhizobium antarcticum TaxID=1798805 RepID=A0A657LQL2_9HYPH|nr:GFA family protein [Pararhizobium antarcticum]OJF95240.1 Gfa-like protein [Rhizobium sp. 58]OJF95373.1 Gfa-like protein [Pararhizobium antarcticum]